MQDGFQEIGIAVLGHSFKKTPGDKPVSLSQFSGDGHLMCRCDDLWLIKQDTAGGRTSKQDFVQQKTLTTANIHDAIKSAEIIGFEHGLSLGARVTRHRAVENSLFFRVLHPIGPSVLPKR